jgi:predicted lipoprotein with Yx(FWY)xxD motif
MRNWIAGAACAAGTVLAATACSSSPSSTAASPAASSATAQASSPAAAATGQASSASASSASATVALQAISGIPGKALVDGQGRTLYLWQADMHDMSTCTGACAAAWPPVTASGTPHAGSGVNQTLLGSFKRADGTEQVTYNGHPLYYFAGDASAGVAKGQGSKAFGADWYVVSASGAKIDND